MKYLDKILNLLMLIFRFLNSSIELKEKKKEEKEVNEVEKNKGKLREAIRDGNDTVINNLLNSIS